MGGSHKGDFAMALQQRKLNGEKGDILLFWKTPFLRSPFSCLFSGHNPEPVSSRNSERPVGGLSVSIESGIRRDRKGVERRRRLPCAAKNHIEKGGI